MVGNKQYPFFYMTVSPTSVGSTFLMKGMLYVTVIQNCKQLKKDASYCSSITAFGVAGPSYYS